jgi:ribonuclease R
VRVQVSRVDLDGRKIDFRLVREGEDLEARAMRDKGVPAGGPGAKRAAKKAPRGVEHVPIKSLTAAVKKAAANKPKGRKGRR